MIADSTSRADNLITEYLRGPDQLALFLAPLGDDALERRMAPGRWTIHEGVLHLLDFEVLQSLRLRKILVEERPALPVLDRNAWLARLGARGRRWRRALMDLRRLREGNVEILHALEAADWEREGLHPERGPIRVRDLIQQSIDHLVEHLKLMRESVAGSEAPSGPGRG